MANSHEEEKLLADRLEGFFTVARKDKWTKIEYNTLNEALSGTPYSVVVGALGILLLRLLREPPFIRRIIAGHQDHYRRLVDLENMWPGGTFIPLSMKPPLPTKFGEFGSNQTRVLLDLTRQYLGAGNDSETLPSLWNSDGLIGLAMAEDGATWVNRYVLLRALEAFQKAPWRKGRQSSDHADETGSVEDRDGISATVSRNDQHYHPDGMGTASGQQLKVEENMHMHPQRLQAYGTSGPSCSLKRSSGSMDDTEHPAKRHRNASHGPAKNLDMNAASASQTPRVADSSAQPVRSSVQRTIEKAERAQKKAIRVIQKLVDMSTEMQSKLAEFEEYKKSVQQSLAEWTTSLSNSQVQEDTNLMLQSFADKLQKAASMEERLTSDIQIVEEALESLRKSYQSAVDKLIR